MAYDYDISYKKGKENVVADALSRLHSRELMALAISSKSTDLMEEIQRSWETNTYLRNIISQVRDHNLPHSTFV